MRALSPRLGMQMSRNSSLVVNSVYLLVNKSVSLRKLCGKKFLNIDCSIYVFEPIVDDCRCISIRTHSSPSIKIRVQSDKCSWRRKQVMVYKQSKTANRSIEIMKQRERYRKWNWCSEQRLSRIYIYICMCLSACLSTVCYVTVDPDIDFRAFVRVSVIVDSLFFLL